MHFKACLLSFLVFFHSCNSNPGLPARGNNPGSSISKENPFANIGQIPLPEGYTRIPADKDPFIGFLRSTGLKKNKTVYLFNGLPKANQKAQFAVLDIDVGNQDLQQCADAVMRLRAEYQFAAKDYGDIIFADNNGTSYTFGPPYTKAHFRNYLHKVFGICGSASLSKQLKPAEMADIRPGDVLIHGGFPGHAVIVMDAAENIQGDRIFLLAQGFMPAQDIHVLVNPVNGTLSPWYKAGQNKIIYTPEYVFYAKELKKW